MNKIVLASSSPRRKKILEDLNLDFKIIPSSFNEKLEDLSFSYKKIEQLAYNKAFDVAKKLKDSALVIGADTVVVLNNQILGKPQNNESAYKMLESLSNKEHFVVTSVCIINSETKEANIESVTSHVAFNELSSDMIKSYINEFNALDKAGAYGIQELPKTFIKSISGNFENIVGLCPEVVIKMLNKN